MNPQETLKSQLETLGAELMARGLYYCEQIKNGVKIPKEEQDQQNELQAQFKFLEQMYTRMVKSGLITQEGDSQRDQNFLDRIKNMKSTLSPIVGRVGDKPQDDEL